MRRRDARNVDSADDEAARLFVGADAGAAGGDDELAAWLADRPERERALERVELAAVLGKRLAAEPTSALQAEAARAARSERRRAGITRGALAWGGALAAAVLAAFFVIRGGAPPADSSHTRPIEAARAVAFAAPNIAAAVLPTGAVVDASAVAVLPFSTSGDAVLAEGLERDVVAALRTVPGLYVIAGEAVQPYAATELSAEDIGGQLGARGIVDAAVERVDGRLYVSARLRDAATGATLWRVDVERPVDELGAIRYEIAESVAATMLDSDLRERAARAVRQREPFSVGKPLAQ